MTNILKGISQNRWRSSYGLAAAAQLQFDFHPATVFNAPFSVKAFFPGSFIESYRLFVTEMWNLWHTDESLPALTHLCKRNVSLKISGHLNYYSSGSMLVIHRGVHVHTGYTAIKQGENQIRSPSLFLSVFLLHTLTCTHTHTHRGRVQEGKQLRPTSSLWGWMWLYSPQENIFANNNSALVFQF